SYIPETHLPHLVHVVAVA
ncbi:unnamed protein product, partial [Allacma fusca]